MSEYDIDDMRQIEATLQGIPPCNARMTFYYDETGNCGKFKVTETGFNDPMALARDFILGGIAFDGEECPADVDSLFAALDLKPDISELKFHHISRKKTNFHEWFGSKRACIFIQWLHASDLYIHYALLNNLYYALVDMVDLLWESQPQSLSLISSDWAFGLKSALYTFCKEHVEDVVVLFRKYHYPDIGRQDSANFCKEFCDLIQFHSDDSSPDGFMIECFRQMLKTAGKEDKLTLLHDNEAGILVDQYYSLYLARCYTYKYAFHYFDEERIIEHLMNEHALLSECKLIKNYVFCTSQMNPLIQISDVFVGILSRVFEFLDNTSEAEINAMDSMQYKNEYENMSMLWDLIERSDTKHPMLLQNINDINCAQERMRKMQLYAKKL